MKDIAESFGNLANFSGPPFFQQSYTFQKSRELAVLAKNRKIVQDQEEKRKIKKTEEDIYYLLT